MSGWVAGAVVTAGVVGAVSSSDAARRASNQQKDALNAANQTSIDQFNAIQTRDQPLVDARNQSLAKMKQLLGLDTSAGSPTDAIKADPGYQFGLTQGTQSMNNTLAAKGMRNSGAALQAAQRYGQDYAGTKFDQAFNRLASVAQLGQVGATSINNAGQNNASTIGGNLISAGNVGAAGSLAQGNIIANTGNQLAGWYANNNSNGGGLINGFNGNSQTGYTNQQPWTVGPNQP
jgi:hypothetical protein